MYHRRLDPMSALCLHVLYEKRKCTESFWYPYISIMHVILFFFRHETEKPRYLAQDIHYYAVFHRYRTKRTAERKADTYVYAAISMNVGDAVNTLLQWNWRTTAQDCMISSAKCRRCWEIRIPTLWPISHTMTFWYSPQSMVHWCFPFQHLTVGMGSDTNKRLLHKHR